MSFGPACERCGANSRESGMDPHPPKCPFCHGYKRRGTREELVYVLNGSKHALRAALGHLRGESTVFTRDEMADVIEKQLRIIDEL